MTTSANASELSSSSPLHENAIKVLLYLKEDATDETASTTELRDATDLSAANISGNHAKGLVERGWIEKTGTEESGAPREANVYTLTHRGRKEANNLLKQHTPPMSEEKQIRTIRDLQNQVEELEDRLTSVEVQDAPSESISSDEFEQLRQKTQSNRKALEEAYNRLDEIYTHLEEL